MSDQLPMFPLSTVVFPGMSVPLHVFEDRYRMLVRHLLEVDDPAQRVFGTVAIREGYEVGEHGAQSVYRVGCVLQLTEVDRRDDGTFDIVAVARERLMLEEMQRGAEFPHGVVAVLPEPEVDVPGEVLDRARATFTAFRVAMTELQGDPFSGTLPRDPDYLAWTLSALTPLPMAERQSLLEADRRHRAPRARHPAADRGAARDQRDPLAPGHPGRAHGLVAQLSGCAAMAKKARAAGGTPATVALTAAGIAFEVRSYEHDPRAASYGTEAAEALGVDPARVFKTLLASLDGDAGRRDRAGDGPARPQGARPGAGREQGGDGRGRRRRARHRLRRRAASPRSARSAPPDRAGRERAGARHDPGVGRPARVRPRARTRRPGGDHRSGDRHHRSLSTGQSVVSLSMPWTTSPSTQPLTPNADSGRDVVADLGVAAHSSVSRTSQSSSASKLT